MIQLTRLGHADANATTLHLLSVHFESLTKLVGGGEVDMCVALALATLYVFGDAHTGRFCRSEKLPQRLLIGLISKVADVRGEGRNRGDRNLVAKGSAGEGCSSVWSESNVRHIQGRSERAPRSGIESR